MPQLQTYPYQEQLMSEWCWCAAAGSVGGFYRNVPALSQCAVADLVFGSPSCNGPNPKPERNLPKPLDAPLRKLGNLARVLDGRIPFDGIVQEIDQGRPVGVRIQWSDIPGAGHMVVLSGYERAMSMVMVEDPRFGREQWSYDTFSQTYLGHGFWSFTYLTRRQSNV